MYRVSAPFEFVPEERRVVDAPVRRPDREVLVDEGDSVTDGDVIARLDTRELEDERRRPAEGEGPSTAGSARPADVERTKARPCVRKSVPRRSRPRWHKLASPRSTAIEKATLRAPVSGVILQVPGQADAQGACRRRRPDRVRRSRSSATRRSSMIEARVADRDIADVHEAGTAFAGHQQPPGHQGADQDHPHHPRRRRRSASQQPTASRSSPCVEEGDVDPTWRPAGTGEVRIDVEPRSLAWQWTHRLVDWVELKLWL